MKFNGSQDAGAGRAEGAHGEGMTETKKYPWLRLLDLALVRPKPEVRQRRGRPRSAFPRQQMYASMTADELEVLDQIVALLRTRFKHPVHRGLVIAFMTLQLRDKLQGAGKRLELPETIDSFLDLAEYLEER